MDRQDIDALLIGALYGELTPAEEARLAAHLESHPADRGALDDLKRARQAVRESRIFDQQLEPPQAVSALLLQEAHRRAPKPPASGEKQSWFFRFARMFLAHPAMAAAAMLVLVVGVAGTLYLKKGDQFAAKEAPSPAFAQDTAVPAEAPGAADRGFAEGAAGSAYSVGLDDNVGAQQGIAAPAADREAEQADKRAEAGKLAEERKASDGAGRRDVAKNKKGSAIVVDTPHRQPKELDAPRAKAASRSTEVAKGDSMRFDDDTFVGGAGGGAAATGTAQATVPRAPAGNAPTAAPMPPPPPVATTKQAKPKPAKKEAQSVADEAKPEPAPSKDNTLIAWAKAQHNRAISLASNGDCRGAARLAVTIEGRAPEYYAQFMATDRSLKKCQAYVAAERQAEAERAAKARASKRATDTQ
jgi:hypothetical protein